jgi:demethylmenaquinone methyltransferase/2-methoxy-6-polyprenyl-1,4-benzoquinol methylase
MAEPDLGAAIREQRAYYEARAAEYDDAYQRTGTYDRGTGGNAAWHADLDRLVDAFERVPVRGAVVELAAGTGFWTERLVRRVRSLTVIDGSDAMLRANRERLGAGAARVHYQVADLFEWHPPRVWDTCVFAFWLCHVPDALVARFLESVATSLPAGGTVCFVDKAASSEPASEQVDRRLEDGRGFTIIDHPRPPEGIVESFARAGLDVEVDTIGTRFCIGQGTRR